jgi:hypothetical protein
VAVSYRALRSNRLDRLRAASVSAPPRSNRVVFVIYLFACVSLLGLLNFEQLSYLRTPIGSLNADDLLLGVIVVGSAPAYWAWRKSHDARAIRVLELAWLGYILLLTLSAVSAPAVSLTEVFVHLRFVSRFAFFFPTVVILNTPVRRKAFLWVSVAIATVGTLFNIAQGLHGGVTLFDSPIYVVELRGEVGDLYRVYLMVTSYVAYVFLLSICVSIVYRRLLITAFSAFLTVSFVIIFFRSLWIGLACGFAVLIAIYAAQRPLRARAIITALAIPILLILAGLILSAVGINAIGDVIGRINDGTFSLSTESGTWGERLNVTSAMFATFDWNNWLLGAGLFGTYWTDFGVIDVFFHLGVLGLIAITFLMLSALAVGVSTIARGIRTGQRMAQCLGGAEVAFSVMLVAYSILTSNFLQPYTMTCLAIATALAASVLAEMAPFRPQSRGIR